MLFWEAVVIVKYLTIRSAVSTSTILREASVQSGGWKVRREEGRGLLIIELKVEVQAGLVTLPRHWKHETGQQPGENVDSAFHWRHRAGRREKCWPGQTGNTRRTELSSLQSYTTTRNISPPLIPPHGPGQPSGGGGGDSGCCCHVVLSGITSSQESCMYLSTASVPSFIVTGLAGWSQISK